jgi:hypothetical protein
MSISKEDRARHNSKVAEFATLNAGKSVHILNYTNKAIIEATARVLGYNRDLDSYLLVDFPDMPEKQKNCWAISSSGITTITLTIEEPVKSAYSVDLRRVRLVVECKPYPHMCRICKAPARRNKDATICSNVSCKSQRKYVKSIRPQHKEQPGKIVKCSKCGTAAMHMVIAKRTSYDNNYTIECSRKHTFDCSVRVADILFLGAEGTALRKYVYDGDQFIFW